MRIVEIKLTLDVIERALILHFQDGLSDPVIAEKVRMDRETVMNVRRAVHRKIETALQTA